MRLLGEGSYWSGERVRDQLPRVSPTGGELVPVIDDDGKAKTVLLSSIGGATAPSDPVGSAVAMAIVLGG